MNWEAIGAIGEVVSAVAVFITLGYLSIQIRHARAEVRRSVSAWRNEAMREANLALALDERFARINVKAQTNMGGAPGWIVKLLMERANLTADEAATFTGVRTALFQLQTQIVENLSELSAGQKAEADGVIRWNYGERSPASQLWYLNMKNGLNPDVVRYIDSVLARPG